MHYESIYGDFGRGFYGIVLTTPLLVETIGDLKLYFTLYVYIYIYTYIYIPRSQRSSFFKGLFQNTGSWVELQVLYRILGVNPVFHKRAVF